MGQSDFEIKKNLPFTIELGTWNIQERILEKMWEIRKPKTKQSS